MNKRKLAVLVGCILLVVLIILLIVNFRGEDDGSIKGRWGEPVETAFLTFTAVEATRDLSDPALPDPPPDWGYLWIGVEIVNHTDRAQSVYYDEFDLYIGGEPRFPERVRSPLQLPEDLLLKPGEAVEGYLLYLVPDGAKKLVLRYDEYLDGDVPGERYSMEVKR